MIKIFVYYFIITDICTSQLWLNGRRYLYDKSTGSIPVNWLGAFAVKFEKNDFYGRFSNNFNNCS